MAVEMIDYAARPAGYDAEECIQKALEDDEIELYYQGRDGKRGHDIYRLTAKGRSASSGHIREVFRKSAEVARNDLERDARERDLAGPAAAGGGGRPPPAAGANSSGDRGEMPG